MAIVRQIDLKHHIDENGDIVKTTNGQIIPSDEPLILFRARDYLALPLLIRYREMCEHDEKVYQSGLSKGIPKEIARLPVPVGRYTRMRASANLRNWLAFLTLRSDHVLSGKAAQFEIRQSANEVSNIIQQTFPRTHALFVGT